MITRTPINTHYMGKTPEEYVAHGENDKSILMMLMLTWFVIQTNQIGYFFLFFFSFLK